MNLLDYIELIRVYCQTNAIPYYIFVCKTIKFIEGHQQLDVQVVGQWCQAIYTLNKMIIYIQQLLLMSTSSDKKAKKVIQCTVCLERPVNSSIDCSHQFCIRCIKKWSKTRNTCPLCRHPYLQIKYKNRVLQIQPPVVPTRPQRTHTPISTAVQQRRIIYVPMLIYPQGNCFLYAPNAGMFMGGTMGDNSGISFPMGSPTFFIPSL